LRTLGFPATHIGSSRELGFEAQFMQATRGQVVDVVLNCLAHEFVDASLRLLPIGGHFVEMGKTDIRDADRVAASHPGVRYRAFDLTEAGPARIQQMLEALLELFERGVLRLPTITTWDVRKAKDAFRALARATHIGKFVLTVPHAFDPRGTVLITGGTGTLGALVARRLVTHHGVRHLLLASRKGSAASAADSLVRELEELGADVTLAACDVSDRAALQALLDAIPAQHPLNAVVHTAGALEDGLLEALTPERIARVFAPKLDAAVHLHELTREQDLAAFVTFSSAAGVLGSPGQANYAAANSFLDALAQHRRAQGLPAASLAWGLWAERSALTRHLTDIDAARMQQSGLRALSSEQGLTLFDAALRRADAALVPATFEPAVLRAHAELLPAMLRLLAGVRPARRTAAQGPTGLALAQRLRALPAADAQRAALELVRGEAANVLGFASVDALEPDRPLKELGLDSLMAVELRNRLAKATGLRLHATLLFDHPTTGALSRFLLGQLRPASDEDANLQLPKAMGLAVHQLEAGMATLIDQRARARLAAQLEALLAKCAQGAAAPARGALAAELDRASDEELLRLIDEVAQEAVL
jgi:NAD(P)-dependent dehydrogenase (short-subunit alcohol dehydrogenase family)